MITLQNIIFPEKDISTEPGLYFHLNDRVEFRSSGSLLQFRPGGTADFGTCFNALGIRKWSENCLLEGLFLSLCGSGEFEVKVIQVALDNAPEVIFQERVKFNSAGEFRADLSHFRKVQHHGFICLELRALGRGSFTAGRFQTGTMPKTLPTLAVSITTFRREAAVQATVRRIEDFLVGYDFRNEIGVFVVDNGQSANIPNSENVTGFMNPNLGGSGGFARGLLEAEKAGFSHCLFMDDDAAFHMENIHRTYVFLALNTSPRTAVAGAMVSNARNSILWENGALFDRRCRPVSGGVNLCKIDELLEMEQQSNTRPAANFYGGWWFFAFPVAYVDHYPFPFFVRGDDINFSLSNNFRIETLSGVISFQDDFSAKESAHTLYLDLRNHLIQHLTIDRLEIGAIRCARIALWFILRNAVKFQYETCDALLLAWKDVMAGPDFFTKNADMSMRRQSLDNIVQVEAFKPVAALDLRERRHFNPTRLRYFLLRPLWRFSLNGHLLPFYSLWANHVVIPPESRSDYRDVWASSRITYLNEARDKGYMVQQSKWRFARLMWQSGLIGVQFIFGYRALRAAYKKQYDEMTSKPYWARLLAQFSVTVAKK